MANSGRKPVLVLIPKATLRWVIKNLTLSKTTACVWCSSCLQEIGCSCTGDWQATRAYVTPQGCLCDPCPISPSIVPSPCDPNNLWPHRDPYYSSKGVRLTQWCGEEEKAENQWRYSEARNHFTAARSDWKVGMLTQAMLSLATKG